MGTTSEFMLAYVVKFARGGCCTLVFNYADELVVRLNPAGI